MSSGRRNDDPIVQLLLTKFGDHTPLRLRDAVWLPGWFRRVSRIKTRELSHSVVGRVLGSYVPITPHAGAPGWSAFSLIALFGQLSSTRTARCYIPCSLQALHPISNVRWTRPRGRYSPNHSAFSLSGQTPRQRVSCHPATSVIILVRAANPCQGPRDHNCLLVVASRPVVCPTESLPWS